MDVKVNQIVKNKSMKFIVSLFTLLIFFIIGFIHNPMMSFAMSNSSMMWMSDTMNCMDAENNDMKICCSSTSNFIKYSSINVNNIKTISKYKVFSFNNIDFLWVNLFSFENSNLIKKTSPPLLERKISNYSYTTLVKIIKSNT